MIMCMNCAEPFFPERHRWLCPHCGWKESCCEGEAQASEIGCPASSIQEALRPTTEAQTQSLRQRKEGDQR